MVPVSTCFLLLVVREDYSPTVSCQGCPITRALTKGSCIECTTKGPDVCLGGDCAVGRHFKQLWSPVTKENTGMT